MDWAEACRTFWPHNSPSKSCCLDPRTGRRILTFSGLRHDWLSLVSLWVPKFPRLLMARSWHFGVRGAPLSMLFLWGWRGSLRNTEGVFNGTFIEATWIWRLKAPLGIGRNSFCLTFLLWTLCAVSFLRFHLLYKAPWEGHLPHPLALELCKSSKFLFTFLEQKQKKDAA